MIRNLLKRILKALQLPLTENLAIDIHTEQIIKQLAQQGKIQNCVDVGVLEGEILELFLKFIPKGQHAGVEPLPKQFEILKAKFKANPNIQLHNFAAGAQNGESTFNMVISNPSYSGLKKRDYPKSEEIKEIKVEVRKLDDILYRAEKIDLIKIDVEGAEYDVLSGATTILKEDKPIIIFEFGLGASNHYGIDANKMYDLLVTQHQYKMYTLKGWLRKEAPLTQDVLEDYYTTNKHYYFIAE